MTYPLEIQNIETLNKCFICESSKLELISDVSFDRN